MLVNNTNDLFDLTDKANNAPIEFCKDELKSLAKNIFKNPNGGLIENLTKGKGLFSTFFA